LFNIQNFSELIKTPAANENIFFQLTPKKKGYRILLRTSRNTEKSNQNRSKNRQFFVRSKCCFWGLIFFMSLAASASAQLATVGAGILTSNRPPEPVFELHGETPPFAQTRAYVTLSWMKSSLKPTVITAAERNILQFTSFSTGLGAGLLWLETNDYKPYPMLVSSTVIPVPVPQTSIVLIGSTLPFQDFDWSLVLKIGVTLVFIR
jgi:hypothetical protein